MKLKDLITLGVAPNDANIPYKRAKAVQSFLALINQLETGRLLVQTFQAAPSRAFKVVVTDEPLSAFDVLHGVDFLEDGPVPEDAALEFYVYLGGPVAEYHNVRAIDKMLTGASNIQVGLRNFLNQFSVSFDPGRAVFLNSAVTEALAFAWNQANGISTPPEEVPPPVVPPVITPFSGYVGAVNIGGRYNAEPGSEVLRVGDKVTEARGTFTYMGGYFMRDV